MRYGSGLLWLLGFFRAREIGEKLAEILYH